MSFLESDYYFCLFTLYKVNKNSVPAMHMQVIGHLGPSFHHIAAPKPSCEGILSCSWEQPAKIYQSKGKEVEKI